MNNLIFVIFVFIYFFSGVFYVCDCSNDSNATFPNILQGEWYSWESGENVIYFVNGQEIDSWGRPSVHSSSRQDIHDYVFKRQSGCLVCSRFIVRSWNILERIDSPCKTLDLTNQDFKEIKRNGCQSSIFKTRTNGVLKGRSFYSARQRGHIMYRQDFRPVNCRHSIYGSFKFAYQITDSFAGECIAHRSRLHSCDSPGSQFSISNQKFLLEFSKCEGFKNTVQGSGEYSCLGEWREGLQHFFIAANMKESRKEERYRCFLKNREDPYYVGMSRSPACGALRTPENSPIRLRLQPLQELVSPSCFLPGNMTGSWVSSGEGEPFVQINSTHIVESRWVGHQMRNNILVCVQRKGNKIQLAKVSEFGCQTEYLCWDVLPRHQNIIRYRTSQTMIDSSFGVCDYGNFGNRQHWKYDTLIANTPNPIECPFSGRFTFGQSGMNPLQPRIIGGITQSPLDTYECTDKATDFAICDAERKNIVIDLDLCQSLNRDGHPLDITSIPDYLLQCVGFWKENMVSYLITQDPFDSVSRFRCWVYQRISVTQLRLSQGLGSSCGLRQTYSSDRFENGGSLALNLTLHERLHDQCPMYYDDGSDPWKPTETTLHIFRFSGSTRVTPCIDIFIYFAIYILFRL